MWQLLLNQQASVELTTKMNWGYSAPKNDTSTNLAVHGIPQQADIGSTYAYNDSPAKGGRILVQQYHHGLPEIRKRLSSHESYFLIL